MDTTQNVEEAVDVLQQLGLKEYEARCFVGLTRLSYGTAKKLGEITDVPRTRVYDAIRVLEAQGLVEVQHSSPQRFRAVPLKEATETLRDQYEARLGRFHDAVGSIEVIESDRESAVQQVWSISGGDAIENRTIQLINEATNEIVLVVGDNAVLTDDFVLCLNSIEDDLDLIVGAVTETLQTEIQATIPDAETFLSGLEWLHSDGETAISRLLLIDRSMILVSSVTPTENVEQAVFGTGFGNGLVVIARRLMAQGLLSTRDPG
jgi:predicted transcriptional regulator